MFTLRRRSTVIIAGLAALTVGFTGPAALAAGKVHHYDLKGEANRPYSIVTGPDGNLWFTESDGNSIGRITPDGQAKRLHPAHARTASPTGSRSGPDGNLWFTERLSQPDRRHQHEGQGRSHEYDLPTHERPAVGHRARW